MGVHLRSRSGGCAAHPRNLEDHAVKLIDKVLCLVIAAGLVTILLPIAVVVGTVEQIFKMGAGIAASDPSNKTKS